MAGLSLSPASFSALSAVEHVGESGINFEQPTDARFIRDQQPGQLDTQCRPGVITINLPVTRVISKTDGVPDALVQNGYISETAKLRMPVYDIDMNGGPPPEVDLITFNGVPLGQLTGANSTWKSNEFDVPIRAVRFGKYNGAGQDPTPGDNVIEIKIATLGGGWCTAVDWVELSFKATSPIILIHGNGSDGAFFARRGFTRELDRQGLLYDNSINMVPSANYVANNAAELNRQIPSIVRGLGVDSVHFVVHSKGGLDSRMYLAGYQPGHEKQFKVLSLTSLGTPHNGSPGADLLVSRRNAINIGATKIEYDKNFPRFTQTLAERLQVDEGKENLTMTWVQAFNAGNVNGLKGVDTVFNTVAGDADTDGDAKINRDPDEYADLRAEDPSLEAADNEFGGTFKTRFVINAAYQFLRSFSGVNVEYQRKDGKLVAKLVGLRTSAPLRNDVLVQEPSGHGEGSIGGRVRNRITFFGAQGRNHANIANEGVAVTVIPWIIGIERERGDLK